MPELSGVPYGNAICYSGYREGQSPRDQSYPSYEQIREDLLLLAEHWKYLRVYDSSPHAETVLEVIKREGLDFRVMLGIDLAAEVSNPQCPWGANFDAETLEKNRRYNAAQVESLLRLANLYPERAFAVSIGNEASVDWTDHLVPTERLVAYAEQVKAGVPQPVTFCENYVPWTTKLAPLVEVLDFISLHTYPVWEFQSIDNALAYTEQNYYSVADRYPEVPVIITEAGWTTNANGRGIEPHNASEELQARYVSELLAWSNREKILTFVFEAFDEPWKGSPDPSEPEKHWGLFNVSRRPKAVMQSLFR
ncbi:MAG: glycosyl hydrolase family 17 protein [Myxococcota bacterium]